MDYLKFDLGFVNSDRIVEVTLQDIAANVRLLDSANYFNYVRNRTFFGIGGLAKTSPVIFTIPTSDHWYVVVDMEGLQGTPVASVKLR